MTASDPRWTIDELGAQVALALSVGYDGPPTGRVRDVPDRRTIRYYTTLGLIDRPAELRGRTAFYGRRHLLQLVAIKRLQARGLSLAEVQQQLVGLGGAALARLAKLPDLDEAAAPAAPAEPKVDRRGGAFWREAPAAGPDETAAAGEADAAGAVFPSPAEPAPLTGVSLDGGVVLLLPAARQLDESDLSAVRAAAAPLLKLLHTRRLLRPRKEGGTP